ncbi:MAG: 50S ribosomal protein L32 [Chloroflexi bacterium]|nr:50S ribosomal protein L32 [Chloroflexota bacterium]
MGVPKRRVSHARKGDRRAHLAISAPQLEECPHCHQMKRSHHACPACGWYAGREAVRIRQARAADSGRA